MTSDERDLIIRRGEAAKRLLEDPIALAAFTAVIDDMKDNWIASRPDDVAGRESFYRLGLAVHQVIAKLEAWAGDYQVEVKKSEARRHDAAFLN